MNANFDAALAMRELGDSFIACIGIAWTKGSRRQRERLEREFAPEFAHYKEVARRLL